MTKGIRISLSHASDCIIAQAKESAELLIAEGWEVTEKSGRHYHVGVYTGDSDALADRLGRRPTRDELISLENQIREHLDDAFDVACPDYSVAA